MDKRKLNLWIVRGLFPVLVGLCGTGLALHLIGHGGSAEVRHALRLVHIILSLLFLVLVGLHIYGHWTWYRSLVTTGCKGLRRWMVVLLAVAFLAVAVTGIVKWLCGVHIGFYHYVGGLVLGVLALLHIIRRWRQLFGRGRNSAAGKGR